MGWVPLSALAVLAALALLVAWSRRRELQSMERAVGERADAERRVAQAGTAATQLQHPIVDLSRCLGCGKCVEACPEQGVLQMVHGQAAVVAGTRCVGHAACERECPVGAITVTLAAAKERRDVPALTPELEAIGTPGLFLAGEVTAHALIHVAIEQGTRVAAAVAQRREAAARSPRANGAAAAQCADPTGGSVPDRDAADRNEVDLLIVGTGPAGFACALEARRRGLRFGVLDHAATVGGTVARYPRGKLVVTRPVVLPLHGKLAKLEYAKEELVALWERIAAQHALPVEHGVELLDVRREADGTFVLLTTKGERRARAVCLALGRRGVPRRLGVPGEELAKVEYALHDARDFAKRRVLVVGGGESAVEAAVALAEQPATRVTLSYRQDGFFRVAPESRARLERHVAARRVELLLNSDVTAITPERVELALRRGEVVEPIAQQNDAVVVLAGGTPPFPLLERAGVSFDPALRPPPRAVVEQGTGIVPALAAATLLCAGALAFALWQRDYYALDSAARPLHPRHDWLRPGGGLGLSFGIGAATLVVVNLLYVVRRAARGRWAIGSLRAWMTSHVATGVLAFLLTLLHAALQPGDSVGGHAFATLAVLLVTGAIGRWFYAWLPRAANGRELALAEVKEKLRAIATGSGAEFRGAGGDAAAAFFARARDRVVALIERQRWLPSLWQRIGALVRTQRELGRALRELEVHGQRAGLPAVELRRALLLARRAHRAALQLAHFEELRAVLSSWRFLHRWVALAMVLLVVLHVACALLFGGAA